MIRLEQLQLTAHLRGKLSGNNDDLNFVDTHIDIHFKRLELLLIIRINV